MPFTPVSQSLTGSGTAASPYQVTTVVTRRSVRRTVPIVSSSPRSIPTSSATTSTGPTSRSRTSAPVDQTPGARCTTPRTASCEDRTPASAATEPPLGAAVDGRGLHARRHSNRPPVREQFVADHLDRQQLRCETTRSGVWADLSDGIALPHACDSCAQQRGQRHRDRMVLPGLAAGASQTFSLNTVIVDTVPAGGFSFSGPAGSTVGGTVATITDPNTSATPSAYSATINWGDGYSPAGTSAGGNGNFNVTGNHAYGAGGTYPVAVTITSVGTSQGSSTVNDSATITAAPAPVVTGAPSVSATGAGLLGFGEPGRPRDDGGLPVRPRPEVLRRRPGRVHELDAGAERWIRLRQPSVSASVSGPGPERDLPRPAGRPRTAPGPRSGPT